ncbi:MAG: SDR family oxidoreductase [Nanoarchaeota archaeon]
MHFKDKVVLITGGNSGIGKATALAFAREGAIVVIVARDRNKLNQTINELKKHNNKCLSYVCDVRDAKKVSGVVKDAIRKFWKINILVNNAGFGIYRGFCESSLDDIKEQMDVNYFGTVNFTKEVLPYMIKQRSGNIVNIASAAGKAGFPGASGYCASKFAVVGLSEALYYEMKKKGINVNLICPGAVDTPFQKNPGYEDFPHEKRHKKIIKAEDVAKAVVDAVRFNRFETILPFGVAVKLWGKGIVPFLWRKIVHTITRNEKY